MNTTSPSAVVQGTDASVLNETSNLRSKVIEILASTANGCLTELGYYPGMPQRLQELERQNAQWQSENVKLFQENQALNRALHEHKGSQAEKTISALQAQIQVLIQEKSILMKHNNSLLAGQPVAYRALLKEYAQFQEYYQRALQEIRTLRHHNAVLSGRTPIQSPVTPGPAVSNLPVFGTQGSTPQVQKSPSSATSFSATPQNPPVNSNQLMIPVLSQQSRQIVIGDQNYARKPTPTMQQAHPLALQSNMHHADRDKDINLPSSISRTSRSPSSRSPRSSRSLSLSINGFIQTPGNISQQDMGNYLPDPLSAPSTSQRHPLHSPVVEGPTQQIRPPVSNSVIPLRKSSLPSLSRLTEPFALLPTPSGLLQMSQTNPSQPIDGAVTPIDIMNDPPLSADVNNNEEQKPLPESLNVLANHIHESSSSATPFEAVTPMNAKPPPVTIVSTPPIESLKRTNLTPRAEPTSKKPRLEEQENIDRFVEPEVDTLDSPAASAKEEDSESSEEEEIQVGPDGLRLVEDCLPALIEGDEENAETKTCKLCTARFKLGYAARPKPFINATTEELVQHCISEHQSAWERLRSTV